MDRPLLKGVAMRTHKSIAVGLLMLGSGAFLLFGDSASLPLWFVWTVGPLLWYLGLALTLVSVMMRLFGRAPERLAEAEAQSRKMSVLRLRRFSRPPAGVLHEIPSMGAFIL
jgi:hypothetical protein